ncbi:MAG: energy transducer TonB [Verrucomicrobia bacterium]|nr:energy transducer TonB [Cytophagales bacterium]
MKKLLLLFLVWLPASLLAQNEEEIIIIEEPAIEESVEHKLELICPIERMPSFPGGMKVCTKFIERNLTYPKNSNLISGKVWVSFVVLETGKISAIKVVKGIGKAFDEEAIKVMKLMPDWIPGKQGGKPVKVRYTLPVNFSVK